MTRTRAHADLRPVAPIVITLVVALFGVAPTLAAQTPPPPTTTLLKRLAQAVDGFRNGELVYVVASENFPHPVVGVYPSEQETDSVLAELSEDYHAFGPYQTERDARPDQDMAFDRQQLALWWVPRHYRPTIHGRAIDGDSVGPAVRIPFEDVDSVAVDIFWDRDADPHRVVLPGDPDLMVLSLSAWDKFLLPYYTILYGADEAADMRRGIVERIKEIP